MPITFGSITLSGITITKDPGGPPGEQQYTTAGTYTWTVPDGVTSVSVVCIGGGAGPTTNGGDSSFGASVSAGGGKSNGTGGTVLIGTGGSGGEGGNQTLGSGGNYGAGGGGGSYGAGYAGGGGGGVGIYGFGASGGNGTNGGGGGGGLGTFGAAGSAGTGGSGGTNGVSERYGPAAGGTYGGGSGAGASFTLGGGGGAAAWTNNITVTPGQQITVIVGARGLYSGVPVGGPGAVRIVWPGTTRQFPSTNVGA